MLRRWGASLGEVYRTPRIGTIGGIGLQQSTIFMWIATALWLIGRVQALRDVAHPTSDRHALEGDVREATKRRAVRSAASVEARLGRSKRAGR